MVQKNLKEEYINLMIEPLKKKFITVFQKNGKKTKSLKLILKLNKYLDLRFLKFNLNFKLIKFCYGFSKNYKIKLLTNKQKLFYSLYLYKSLLKKKQKITSFKFIINEFNLLKKEQGLLYKKYQNLIKQALANRILI